MRVSYRPHHQFVHRFGAPFAIALQAAGHELVDDGGDVLLIDLDADWSPWRERCDAHAGAVLYPEGGGWVMPYPRHPRTLGQLVTGVGSVELAEMLGDVPTVAVGWPWTQLLPFRPAAEVRRIFFAPAHPHADGTRVDDGARLALRRLGKRYPAALWSISETVRPFDDTAVLLGGADLCATSSMTVLALAVALGVPTVLFGDPPVILAPFDDRTRTWIRPPAAVAESWRYPYGVNDVEEAIAMEAGQWRKRFVGEPATSASIAAGFTELVA